MELLIARCAGVDVHKETVVATVRIPDEQRGRRSVTETFGTMTADLLALREWLQAYGVTYVALESTGVYWKPVYYMLEEGFTLLLINMQDLSACRGARPTCATVSGWRSCGSGLDPVWWTSFLWGIRCPDRWERHPSAGPAAIRSRLQGPGCSARARRGQERGQRGPRPRSDRDSAA